MNIKRIRKELEKQGVLSILEEHGCAINEGDWCNECYTHKHICGHEKAGNVKEGCMKCAKFH